MRFARGQTPKISYENTTLFTFNIHYHGLNTTGSLDGTSMEDVFGHSTKLGPKVTFQFPLITNNQSLIWFHSHNMFISMELAYSGIVGLLQIVDEQTSWMNQQFKYGDNQILLAALDMDLTENGTQTYDNLIVGGNRSNFTVVNGVSAVNWYTHDEVKFVEPLYHNVTKNLVKVDILNASMNWRIFYLGVCDHKGMIKNFHQVQVDSGLMNPSELNIVTIPTGGRIGIIIDLDEFKHQVAYLFFYNYDLSEIDNGALTFPEDPNNRSITGTIPDIENVKNPVPTPTPIPNQGGSNLNYPIVDEIPRITQVLENGSIKIPEKFTIKTFLKISQVSEKGSHIRIKTRENPQSLYKTISRIQRVVFGKKNHILYKKIISQPGFEYNPLVNYTNLLNKKYFYNLPNFNPDVPVRNICLFVENDINAIAGGNPHGTTEYIEGTERMMADQWNSSQLDLNWALEQYSRSPNNYKPPVLPTSKFKIRKTNDDFSNIAMMSNDTLKIQFYTQEIPYGDHSNKPIATAKVIFPPTPDYETINIQQWIDLVNKTFSENKISLEGTEISLDSILKCDWSFFPYAMNMMYEKKHYIKSAVIKTENNSKYWIRFLGRWPILQFFGKPLTGNTLVTQNQIVTPQRKRLRHHHAKLRHKIHHHEVPVVNKVCSKLPNRQPPNVGRGQYIKCNEMEIFGIADAEIQQMFPFYASFDGGIQLPIACMKRDGEMILAPEETYIGLYDGYLNDNLSVFSVKLKSSEVWNYINGDTRDAHSLHFHLTSGYASPHSNYNSPELLSCRREHDPLIYSRDIYQIGPQETVSFNLTWPEYSSYDTTSTPKNIRCAGGVVHCHLLQHNDANSMIIQYFVDK
jgi:FtsP/CotA-like multicopper oxidase with cupredoxin domain